MANTIRTVKLECMYCNDLPTRLVITDHNEFGYCCELHEPQVMADALEYLASE